MVMGPEPVEVTIGTFNLHNLYNRYTLKEVERGAFRSKPIDPDQFVQEGGHVNMMNRSIDDSGPVSKSKREVTAEVILANKPDVLAVQEVENLNALEGFNKKYLDGYFPYSMVIPGNDERSSNVGIMSKYPIDALRTHRFDKLEHDSSKPVFSRDCLEADIRLPNDQTLTMMVNHFKSKLGDGDIMREQQAERVSAIIDSRAEQKGGLGNVIVIGDLNDTPDSKPLQPLMSNPRLEPLLDRLPEQERWTYSYRGSRDQIDHILVAKELADRNSEAIPHIERRGLATSVKAFDGERFPEVDSKAGGSDHAAVFVTLKV